MLFTTPEFLKAEGRNMIFFSINTLIMSIPSTLTDEIDEKIWKNVSILKEVK